MIRFGGGRSWSERTLDELEQFCKADYSKLTPEEREVFQLLLDELDDSKTPAIAVPATRLVDALGSADWKTTPVDIETFVKDPYFLGESCSGMYPKLLNKMIELFGGEYYEAFLCGAIGYGKCSTFDTRLTNLATGERRRIGELVGQTPLVPSFDGKNIVPARASKIWKSGRKQCAKLVLASGQWLDASLDHPVLVASGDYAPLGSLQPGQFVARARFVPAPLQPLDISDAEVLTLAYLIADGSLTHNAHLYCKGDRRLVDDFRVHACQLPAFREFGVENFKQGAWYVSFLGLDAWAASWGIRCRSKEKRVPPRLFGLRDRQLALFLNRVFTDGSVYVNKTPRRIELTLASEGLIDDVQELLQRFGICVRKYYTPKSAVRGEKKHAAWTICIADAPSLLLFLAAVGPIFGKEAACETLLEYAQEIKANTNWDVVPVGYEELKEIRKETGPHNKHWWAKHGLVQRDSYMSRDKFQRLCAAVNYTGRYRWYAEAELVWEKVESVTPTGMQDVYDLTVPGTHNAVANGIVIHNTFFASTGLCRVLYELSCMKNPQKSFGLSADSTIAITCMSVSEALAIRVAFDNIAAKVKLSPYFNKQFQFRATKKELRFPSAIWVAARAATDSGALGLNTFAAFIDEANFYGRYYEQSSVGRGGAPGGRVGAPVDMAERVYDILRRRIKSRFDRGGKLPGILFVGSSKTARGDFTERKILEYAKDPHVFVMDYSNWDVKPDIFFDSKRFWVLVGNEAVPSRILLEGEEKEFQASLPENTILIDVPEDFKADFESDIEGSIRDLAGLSTVSINPFIQRREKIREAIDPSRSHPFTTMLLDPSRPGKFRWDIMVAPRMERLSGTHEQLVQRPLLNPLAFRYVHLDLSLRGDATGFCMAHIGGWKDVPRRAVDGRQFLERAPIYIIDLMLKIVPPAGGEIILADVRHIVYDLTAHGYSIRRVTLDSWQSADSIQQFKSQGYSAELLSLDIAPEPYDSFKTALYEGRVRYYEYEPAIQQLELLQEDRRSKKRKIDHPPKGEKDVSDAMAGVCFSLQKYMVSEPLPMLTTQPSVVDPWMDAVRPGVPGIQSPSGAVSTMEGVTLPKGSGILPPFLGGGFGSGD
jgi:hypothetical protein